MYLILAGFIMLVSWLVSNRLKSKFELYSKLQLQNGMSGKEIAEKMFCSPRTVESYRDSLFEKLELKTRVGLAVFALKNGFE